MKQFLGLSSGLCMILIFCVMKMEHSETIWFFRDKLTLAMLFWEDIIILLVCLKYYCFYIIHLTLVFNLMDLNIHATINKITWINMLGSIPHKILFLSFTYSRTRRNYAWGCLLRLQRIYNFWLLHAILSTVLDIIGLYYPLLYYFWD